MPTSEATPVFKRLAPEVQQLYNEFMEHAEQCERDVLQHEHALQMHQLMTQGRLAGMTSVMSGLIEESQRMGQASREMAYLLLKDSVE